MSNTRLSEAKERETPSEPLALRPKAAARMLGIGERLLWSKTNAGEIPHCRIGRAVVYPVDALRAWLNEQAKGGAAMNGDHGDDARDVKHESEERQEFHEHQRGVRGARKDNVCPERGTARDDVRTPQERARARLQAHFDVGTTPDLSLQEHVLAAMEMEATSGHLEDFKVMFTFTRAMKTAPALDEKTAAQALAEIEKVIARWPLEDDDLPKNASIARRAAAQWATSLGFDAEDARANFLGIWDKVRTLPNRSPLDHALELAERRPINFPDSSCLQVDTEGYRRFVSLAGWLQVTRGNAPILLPVEKVGDRLGVKAMTVSRYRDWGESDRFLRKVAEHRFRSRPSPSGERSTATEYRFDVSRVPMLEHAAQRGTVEAFRNAEG